MASLQLGGLANSDWRTLTADPSHSHDSVAGDRSGFTRYSLSDFEAAPRPREGSMTGPATADLTQGLLHCIMFNARSLKNKLADFYEIIYNNSYNCIFITETWLNDNLPNSLLDPESMFNVYRDDRLDRTGGGVCCLIAKHFRVAQMSVDKACNSNVVAFDLLVDYTSYRFIVTYRPPLYNAKGLEDALKLHSVIEHQVSCSTGPAYVIGDINCRGIDWTYTTESANNVERIIGEVFRNNGFAQCVPQATRGSSLLDIVCTNEPLTLYSIDVLPPYALSDHSSVVFDITLPCIANNSENDNCSEYTRYLLTKANYTAMADYLAGVRWADIFTTNFTADGMWNAFQTKFNEAIELLVPSVRSQRKPKSVKRK